MTSASNNPKVTRKQKDESHRKEMVEEYLEYVRRLEDIIEPITTSFTRIDADGELVSISIQQSEGGTFNGYTRRYTTDSNGNTRRQIAFTEGDSFAGVLSAIAQCLQHDLFKWRDDKFWKPKRGLPAHLG